MSADDFEVPACVVLTDVSDLQKMLHGAIFDTPGNVEFLAFVVGKDNLFYEVIAVGFEDGPPSATDEAAALGQLVAEAIADEVQEVVILRHVFEPRGWFDLDEKPMAYMENAVRRYGLTPRGVAQTIGRISPDGQVKYEAVLID